MDVNRTPDPTRARRPSAGARFTAPAYAGLAALWILVSELVVGWLFSDPVHAALAGTDRYPVAKVDGAEFYTAAFTDAVRMGLAGLLALIVILTGLAMLRQRHRLAASEGARRAETARVRALELLEAFAESTEDAIFAKDLEGRYILFNRAAGLFVGKPAEAVLGRDDRGLFPPEQAEMLMDLDRRAIRENRTRTAEESLDTPRGTRIFLTTKGPLRDEHGRVIGTFGIARDITDSRQAEDQLADQMRRFRLLLDSSRDGIVVIDQEHRVVEANQRFADMLDYAPEALKGLHTWDFDAVYSELEIRAGFTDLSRLKRQFETRHRRRDGSEYDVEISASGAVWDGRNLVLCICRDITERRRTELALRASEQRFHDIVSASADWFWEVDAQGRYTYASEGVHGLLGYAPEEILGKTPFDLMPTAEADRVREEFAAIAARKLPFRDLDNINMHRDGSIRHVQTNGMPILDEAGTLLGFRGLDRDVTEHKTAELALRDMSHRLRALIDTIPDLIWLKDPEGVYLACNRRFEALYGAREADIVGKTDYDFIPREAADFFRAHDQAAAAQGTPRINEEELTFSGDGHRERVQTIKTPLYDGEGRLIGVLGIARDITAIKAAEEELRQRNAELERFNQASVGRELDMIELKRRINALAGELGRPAPFPLSFLNGPPGETEP